MIYEAPIGSNSWSTDETRIIKIATKLMLVIKRKASAMFAL